MSAEKLGLSEMEKMKEDKNFIGVIIEESLEDKEVLERIKIIKVKVEQVTKEHKTPWINQWTLCTVEVSKEEVDSIAKEISKALDSRHNWYADFKNDSIHYVIYRNKIFKINRANRKEYDQATKYGISLGIPEYQVDFSSYVKKWERDKHLLDLKVKNDREK